MTNIYKQYNKGNEVTNSQNRWLQGSNTGLLNKPRLQDPAPTQTTTTTTENPLNKLAAENNKINLCELK